MSLFHHKEKLKNLNDSAVCICGCKYIKINQQINPEFFIQLTCLNCKRTSPKARTYLDAVYKWNEMISKESS